MRVQEKDPESCSNMTEEKSMNGGPHDVPSGSKRTQGSKEVPSLTATSEADRLTSIAGGRLKFFKDGKFILELSHHAEEGRGGAWLPVPKKTYWPPPGAAGTPRAEGSTSLSVSDDNSSVQSSPWQRDHCWKQATPVRCRGQSLSFVMRASPSVRRLRSSASARRKRRRPLDLGVPGPPLNSVPIPPRHPRRSLATVVRALTERCAAAAARADPGVVSPRKRILREMERVSLEDLANSKRQRARSTNGASVCKYSITSLLAEGPAAAPTEPSFLRTLLRSPPPPRPTPHPSVPAPFLAPPMLFSAPAYAPTAAPAAAPAAASYYQHAWMPYPLSSLPPAWGAPMPVARSDEPCADVPLNLSKHKG